MSDKFIHMNVSAELRQDLESLAGKKGLTMTQVVRAAVGLLARVESEQEKGARLVFVAQDGKAREVLVL